MTGARRILYVSHSQEVGGTEVHLEGLARYATREAGLEVSLVCRDDPAVDRLAEGVAALGVQVTRLSLRRAGDYGRLAVLVGRADLVHLMLAHPVGRYQQVAARLAWLRRRPLVITHHLPLDLGEVELSGWERAAWRRLVRGYGRMARWNLAVSEAGRRLLLDLYGFPAGTCRVVHNGVDTGFYRPPAPAERERLRAALLAAVGGRGWSAADPLLLTVARLTPQKGLFELVEAAALVAAAEPRARFVIAGEGGLRAELEAAIAAAGLGDTVRLAGARPPEEIAGWLGAADLFLLPSREEGLPLALLEAMAAGLPAVATRVGGVAEVIQEGYGGWLVPPARPAVLAEAVIRALADRPALVAAGKAARDRVVAKFDLRRCFAETVGYYR